METSCFCFQRVAQIPDRRDGLQTPFPDVASRHERVLQQVRTHVHLPSLGASGQHTRPPPVPGGQGTSSRELHRARPKDTDAELEGQGCRQRSFVLALMIDAK